MIYKPCNHCLLRQEACPDLEQVKAQMKVLKVKATSIALKCEAYCSIKAGTRIEAEFRMFKGGMFWNGTRKGTVIRYCTEGVTKGKVMLWLDKPTIHRERESTIVRVWPDRLRFIDEEPLRVCRYCCKPEGKNHVDPELWGGCECAYEEEESA